MNDWRVRETAEQIGTRVLGQGNRTRSEELAGVMLAFLTFARACGMYDAEIAAMLDAGKAMIPGLAPNSMGVMMALVPEVPRPD